MSVNAMRSIWEEDAVKPERRQDFDDIEIRTAPAHTGWIAWAEDEPVIGWALTRDAAIADLKEQLEETEE